MREGEFARAVRLLAKSHRLCPSPHTASLRAFVAQCRWDSVISLTCFTCSQSIVPKSVQTQRLARARRQEHPGLRVRLPRLPAVKRGRGARFVPPVSYNAFDALRMRHFPTSHCPIDGRCWLCSSPSALQPCTACWAGLLFDRGAHRHFTIRTRQVTHHRREGKGVGAMGVPDGPPGSTSTRLAASSGPCCSPWASTWRCGVDDTQDPCYPSHAAATRAAVHDITLMDTHKLLASGAASQGALQHPPICDHVRM